jgi:hypothetical protein
MTDTQQQKTMTYPVKSPRQEDKVYVFVGANHGKPHPTAVVQNHGGGSIKIETIIDEVTVEGVYEVYDNYESDYEKQWKVMHLETTEQVRDSKTRALKTEKRTRYIDFSGGILRVHAKKEYQLFRFLWCHPQFQDGPYFDPTKPAIFKLLKTEREKGTRRPSMSEMHKSVTAFQSATRLDSTKARQMAVDLRQRHPDLFPECLGLSPSAIKEEVAYFAQMHPDLYIKVTPDLSAQIRFAIESAKAMGQLLFNEDGRQWYLGKRKFFAAPIGTPAEDALLLYLYPQPSDKDYTQRESARIQLFSIANFEDEEEQLFDDNDVDDDNDTDVDDSTPEEVENSFLSASVSNKGKRNSKNTEVEAAL